MAPIERIADPGPRHPPALGATPPFPQICRGKPGTRPEFPLPGPGREAQPPPQNLNLFLQIADGVNDETWMHHLRQGDYSEWFRDKIKDAELADEAKQIEQQSVRQPAGLRTAIREAVERRYTLPSEPAEYTKAAEAESEGKADSRK